MFDTKLLDEVKKSVIVIIQQASILESPAAANSTMRAALIYATMIW